MLVRLTYNFHQGQPVLVPKEGAFIAFPVQTGGRLDFQWKPFGQVVAVEGVETSDGISCLVTIDIDAELDPLDTTALEAQQAKAAPDAK